MVHVHVGAGAVGPSGVDSSVSLINQHLRDTLAGKPLRCTRDILGPRACRVAPAVGVVQLYRPRLPPSNPTPVYRTRTVPLSSTASPGW